MTSGARTSDAGKPTLFAKFTAAEGRSGELVSRLQKLIEISAEDPGVEIYRMHVTLDDQAVWFYEQYADDDAGKAHREEPEVRKILDSLGELVASREIVAGRLLDAVERPAAG